MSSKHLLILVVLAAVVMKAAIWFKDRQERTRKTQVKAANVAAVDRFESVGGGF